MVEPMISWSPPPPFGGQSDFVATEPQLPGKDPGFLLYPLPGELDKATDTWMTAKPKATHNLA